MPPLTRRITAATAAEKRAAGPADIAAETSAAKRTRTPVVAAANEQAAVASARPANDAIFAQVRTLLFVLPSQERAGYLHKSFASGPDVIAFLHDKFAGLFEEPATDADRAAGPVPQGPDHRTRGGAQGVRGRGRHVRPGPLL